MIERPMPVENEPQKWLNQLSAISKETDTDFAVVLYVAVQFFCRYYENWKKEEGLTGEQVFDRLKRWQSGLDESMMKKSTSPGLDQS